MSAMKDALKRHMSKPASPEAHTDPVSLGMHGDKAPEIGAGSVPHGTTPGMPGDLSQLSPEQLQQMLMALMGHGGPLAQHAQSMHQPAPEGSPLEEAGESPMKEKKEMGSPKPGKSHPFRRF